MSNVIIPAGFKVTEGSEVVAVDPISLPGATHPHWLVTVKEPVTEATRIRATSILAVYEPQANRMPEGEERTQRLRELEVIREVAAGDSVFTVVGYCETGGPLVYEASATRTGAEAIALKLRVAAEGIDA